MTLLCKVVDRGRGVLIVKGHQKPTDDYDGFWIGPVSEDGCGLYTERSWRHNIKE